LRLVCRRNMTAAHYKGGHYPGNDLGLHYAALPPIVASCPYSDQLLVTRKFWSPGANRPSQASVPTRSSSFHEAAVDTTPRNAPKHPLAGGAIGLEPPVRRARRRCSPEARSRRPFARFSYSRISDFRARGTKGSNLVSSTGESAANFLPSRQRMTPGPGNREVQRKPAARNWKFESTSRLTPWRGRSS
jgi:hypothetical protein